ncbi:MAG TPA: hypothetical protein VJH04_01230 [archaeon]|nr:hypothetical protein [archaeon]
MNDRKILKTTAAVTGFAVGYLIARAFDSNTNNDLFMYTNDELLRKAQACGMAIDEIEMDRKYGSSIVH